MRGKGFIRNMGLEESSVGALDRQKDDHVGPRAKEA